MLGVVSLLYLAAALGLGYRALHGFGHAVGVHYYNALGVSRGSAYCLHEGSLASQEAFLVRVEYRHEGHLRNIQTLAQQVYSDKHVEFPGAQVADKFHSLYRVDVVVHVAHLDIQLGEVICEILRHLLRERGDEHALFLRNAGVYLGDQILDLTLRRLHNYLRIKQPGGSDDLLNYLGGMLLLEVARCRGNEHRLSYL